MSNHHHHGRDHSHHAHVHNHAHGQASGMPGLGFAASFLVAGLGSRLLALLPLLAGLWALIAWAILSEM